MFYLHLPCVLDPLRCSEILAQAQAIGFETSKVNYYGEQRLMTDIRRNERLEWDNEALARELGDALKQAAGAQFPASVDGMPYVGPASHLRVYRYVPGDYFKTHRDGKFRQGGLLTRVTVLAYLNDADGGETVLMPEGPEQPEKFVAVTPRAGDVLLFQHELWHEGRPVQAGNKFVLRTDLFYQIIASDLLPADAAE
jgi:predicted 2-oxoglutarate/Fe(II)-dependent dioxygenase YbiX